MSAAAERADRTNSVKENDRSTFLGSQTAITPSWRKTSWWHQYLHDTNEPNVNERYDTPYDKPFCNCVRRSGLLITIATGLRSNAVPEITDHDS